MPTRGSRTSSRISSASSRWSWSPIRRVRGKSLGMTLLAMLAWRALQLARHLDPLVALDLVADADIVVVPDADAALGAGLHFVDVVLEAPQRLQLALEDHHVVAQHPDRVAPAHHALGDQAAGDLADLGRAEHVANFGQADDALLHFWLKHSADRALEHFDRVVVAVLVVQVES